MKYRWITETRFDPRDIPADLIEPGDTWRDLANRDFSLAAPANFAESDFSSELEFEAGDPDPDALVETGDIKP